MIVCSHCGLEAQMNDRYCKGCGHRFSVTDGDYSGGSLGANAGFASSRGTSFASWTSSGANVTNFPDMGRSNGTAGSPSAGDYGSGAGEVTDQHNQVPYENASAGTSAVPPTVAVGVATSEPERPAQPSPKTIPAPPATPAAATSVGRLIVRVQSGAPGDEREYVLDGLSVTVGRSPSCDVVLDRDPLISRRHALLKYEHGQYVLVDLGSSNGTFINEQEIHEAVPLRNGDRILVGEHELTYSTEPASTKATTAGASPRGAYPVPPPRTDPHIPAVVLQSVGDVGEAPTVPGETLEAVAEADTIFSPGPHEQAMANEEATTNILGLTGNATPAQAAPHDHTGDVADISDEPTDTQIGRTVHPQEVPLQGESGAPAAHEHHDGALPASMADPWDAFQVGNLPAQYGVTEAPGGADPITVPTTQAETGAGIDSVATPAVLAEAVVVSEVGEHQPTTLAEVAGALNSPNTPIEAGPSITDMGPTGSDSETNTAPSIAPAPVSAPPAMPKPGDSIIDHISAIQDYAQRLRQRTEEAENLSAQRQQALTEARDRLGAILAEQQRYATPVGNGEDLEPLIEIARQAAENPRHLDTITQLSEHAQDILNALQRRQTQQSAPIEAQRALQNLHEWLSRQK